MTQNSEERFIIKILCTSREPQFLLGAPKECFIFIISLKMRLYQQIVILDVHFRLATSFIIKIIGVTASASALGPLFFTYADKQLNLSNPC